MQTAALYIRVSTEDQTEYSPDAQKRALMEYAKRNNMLVSNEFIFMDEGISGRKAEKRPAFMKMIALAKSKPRPFDVILVHKFDRFARSREDSIVYKSMLRKNCGISVISITEHIEDDKFSVILEAMLEAMAEYYSLNLADEVRKGMSEKARRGEYQTYAPFGYRWENKHLIPNEHADTVRMMYDSYLNQNKSFFSLTRELNSLGIPTINGNKWEVRTVKYVLQNPIYKGYVRWNPNGKKDFRKNSETEEGCIIEKGSHPPIVPEALWDAVNDKILAQRPAAYRKPAELYSNWLGGMMRCSSCGSVLASAGRTGYQCSSYSKGKCRISHFISLPKAEYAVREGLQVFLDSGEFDYSINTSRDQEQISALSGQLAKIATKEARIKEAYLAGIDSLDEYRESKQKLAEEKANIESSIKELATPRTKAGTRDEMLVRLRDVYQIICSDTDNLTKHTAIQGIIDHIIYDKATEKMDIFLYFS